ncbi:hypothetical protein N0V82_010199 [Gnomoniopsis sp. IMI 355080]|nr:hypothetical protein N0V82_010199 [Gnomoniopsis sp. IMI 355080]
MLDDLTFKIMANEPSIARSRLPRGYSFVPKGNVYITGNCRKQTQAANQTVYLVVNAKEKQVGIAVPAEIYENVRQTEAETRATRAANVDRRDNSIKNHFEQVILREFPRLPRQDLPKILEKALEKRSGKVGRTGQLSDQKKAQLAVRAHIRHRHTQYEKLLKGLRREDKGEGKAKNLARKTVQSQVDELAARWAQGRSGQQPPRLTRPPAMASSSACPPPPRSTGIGRSNGASRSVGAKLARVDRSAMAHKRTPAIVPPPTWPDGAPSSSQRPFEMWKEISDDFIDLTMEEEEEDDNDEDDDDDDDDDYNYDDEDDDDDDDLPDLMVSAMNWAPRRR